MEKKYLSSPTLLSVVATLCATLTLTEVTQGYAQTASPAPVMACQNSWYQCIKADQQNPTLGYVGKVVDQFLDGAGGRVVISLEDQFPKRGKKPTSEELCQVGLTRLYNMMTSPSERSDAVARNYFAGQRLCPRNISEMPSASYPWMLFQSATRK